MRGWIVAAAIAATLLLAGLTGAQEYVKEGTGRWSVTCKFSHSAPDDPIVFPGQPGASHQHDFFGSQVTDAFTNHSKLMSSPGLCTRSADHSAYWVPTMSGDDAVGDPGHTAVIRPLHAQVYYVTDHRDQKTIEPFPPGLQMIAGDPTARVRADHVLWNCGGAGSAWLHGPVACHPGSHLQVRVDFPDCSDGRVSSADHRSHVAYAHPVGSQHPFAPRACPRSHPIPIPQVRLIVVYRKPPPWPTHPSSGSPYSFHADFFEGWRAGSVKRLIKDCIQANVRCPHF